MTTVAAVIRLVHPAPAIAVVTLSAVLGTILSLQSGLEPGAQLALTTLLPGGAPIIPPIVYEVHSSVRHTTLAASLWFQQQLSASVGLAYLGGMSFGRTTSEFQVSYTGFPRGLPVVPPPSITSESIEYGVRPMVGFEVRIAMTDRARIVPGLRLHAESGLWLVRPSVALGWSF